MKTINFRFSISTLALMLCASMIFSSCKKTPTIDEEDFNIVGTWADTKYPSSSSTYYTIVFKSDKTGSFNYHSNGKFEYSEMFEYAYSNGRALITWKGYYDNDNKHYYDDDSDYEVWNIEFKDSKTIMLSGDEDGVYYKQ